MLLFLPIVQVCDDFKFQNSYRSRNRENGADFDPEIQFDLGFLPQISQMVADHEAQKFAFIRVISGGIHLLCFLSVLL